MRKGKGITLVLLLLAPVSLVGCGSGLAGTCCAGVRVQQGKEPA